MVVERYGYARHRFVWILPTDKLTPRNQGYNMGFYGTLKMIFYKVSIHLLPYFIYMFDRIVSCHQYNPNVLSLRPANEM